MIDKHNNISQHNPRLGPIVVKTERSQQSVTQDRNYITSAYTVTQHSHNMTIKAAAIQLKINILIVIFNCFKKRLDDWCGNIKSAYIHYYYKLQVTRLIANK